MIVVVAVTSVAAVVVAQTVLQFVRPFFLFVWPSLLAFFRPHLFPTILVKLFCKSCQPVFFVFWSDQVDQETRRWVGILGVFFCSIFTCGGHF